MHPVIYVSILRVLPRGLLTRQPRIVFFAFKSPPIMYLRPNVFKKCSNYICVIECRGGEYAVTIFMYIFFKGMELGCREFDIIVRYDRVGLIV